MELKGWVRSSLIDYPERIATVVFTGGCNFRCPMCHNADLVLHPNELPSIDTEQIWDYLRRRAGLITGVVITGGEPTLQPDLAGFCRQAREVGAAVKLDTNGYRPDCLEALLADGLLDYVALDIKAPPDLYARLVGRADVDSHRIERSMALLRASGVPHELRTTVVPGLLGLDDIRALARWIAGAERYVLQQFRGASTLDPELSGRTPYMPELLADMADVAREWVSEVQIRGV